MTEEEYMNYQIMMIAEQESHKRDNPGAYTNKVPDSEMTHQDEEEEY